MAVARKKKESGGGAPAWMVTYGDMVTLLLTFFVLLLSMSEIKKEEQLMDFMEAIRNAFGYQSKLDQAPAHDEIHKPRNVEMALQTLIPFKPEDFSTSQEEGVKGTRSTVRPIRNADRFVFGAPVQFDELSDELRPDQLELIRQFADRQRGLYTEIEVRGHCSRKPVADTPFDSHRALAYARARRVADALAEFGLDPARVIVISAGTNEPLARGAYLPQQRLRNDIVELIQVSRAYDDGRNPADPVLP